MADKERAVGDGAELTLRNYAQRQLDAIRKTGKPDPNILVRLQNEEAAAKEQPSKDKKRRLF